MKNMKAMLCALIAALIAIVPVCATAETIWSAVVKSDCEVYNAEFQTVQTLKEGEHVVCRATESTSTLRVATQSGKTGYVYSGYLTKKDGVDIKKIGQAKKQLKVYKKKDGNFVVVTEIPAGYPVYVKEVKNGIAYVKSPSGETGYVRASGLKHVK